MAALQAAGSAGKRLGRADGLFQRWNGASPRLATRARRRVLAVPRRRHPAGSPGRGPRIARSLAAPWFRGAAVL